MDSDCNLQPVNETITGRFLPKSVVSQEEIQGATVDYVFVVEKERATVLAKTNKVSDLKRLNGVREQQM